MPSKDKGFLVEATVHLIGGHILTEIDAFRADSEQEAENMAFNIFVTGQGLIVYGKQGIVADTISAVRVDSIEEIDLAAPINKQWLDSVEFFERFLEQQDAKEQKSHRSVSVTPRSFIG
jgi:hypothetical protein